MTRPTPGQVAPALARLRAKSASLLPLQALASTRYAAGHRAFEARSSQRGLLADRLAALVGAGSGPLSVLSVGCGDGALDAMVLSEALDRRRAVSYLGLDPDAASVAGCASRLTALAGVEATARVAGLPWLGVRRRFDVVLAVHCLYYVADLPQAVQALRRRVQPGGSLVLVLAPRRGLNQLADLLAPPLAGRSQWWAEDLSGTGAVPVATAEAERVTGQLALEDCLEPSDPVGRAVLDFIVQARLPDLLHAPVVQVLQAMAAPGPGVAVEHPVQVLQLAC